MSETSPQEEGTTRVVVDLDETQMRRLRSLLPAAATRSLRDATLVMVAIDLAYQRQVDRAFASAAAEENRA